MSRIKIKNFGPIKNGFEENDGFIDIRKITIFIGNQGTGKSSIAKLISVMSWLEKALYIGELTEKDATNYNRFVNNYCNYHNLKNYFLPDTEIEYRGTIYNINFSNRKLNISSAIDGDEAKYVVPKIMYVPAERNFLSAVKQPEKLKGLPQSLYDFWIELERSQKDLSKNLTLPIGNVEFQFDKLNKIPNIVGSDYKIRLSEASSGFQSLVPLFLVSRDLALSISKEKDTSRSALSSEEQKRLKLEIEKILSNDHLSDDLKQAALELLSVKYRNGCFINITEELEQNLFPESQRDIFYKLIEFANFTNGNQLILTTHSPYIINYLTLAIKGSSVWQKIKDSSSSNGLKEKLEKIVPELSCVSASDAIVYELTKEGQIKKLPTYDGLPSDENYLNSSLAETNDSFSDLLEIEDSDLLEIEEEA
jgi:predicted ATPase